MKFIREHKGKLYLLIFASAALCIMLFMLIKIKPTVIDASCSDVATRSSSLLNRGVDGFEDAYSYENLKNKCL